MSRWPCWSHYSDVIKRSGVSNCQRLDCLLNRLFSRRFPSQRASNAESVSNWSRRHAFEQDPPLQSNQISKDPWKFCGILKRVPYMRCKYLRQVRHWLELKWRKLAQIFIRQIFWLIFIRSGMHIIHFNCWSKLSIFVPIRKWLLNTRTYIL